MCFDMLFQILGPFECLATKVTSMRLQGHVNADVRGNMVAFDNGNVAIGPSTFQVEVIRAFPADVDFANMVLSSIRRYKERKERVSRTYRASALWVLSRQPDHKH